MESNRVEYKRELSDGFERKSSKKTLVETPVEMPVETWGFRKLKLIKQWVSGEPRIIREAQVKAQVDSGLELRLESGLESLQKYRLTGMGKGLLSKAGGRHE
jgi:hypothetical protein